MLRLNEITEWQRLNGGERCSISRRFQHVCRLGKLGCALQVDLDSGLAGFLFGGFVLLFTSQDFHLTFGSTYVLNTNVNSLFKDSAIDKLIDTDTHSRLGHIEDNSSASMISLVWHTLVDGRISKDVDIIPHFDIHQVLRKMDGTLAAELPREHMTRTRPSTKRVRHGGV
jgi:hypothetical protein